MDRKTQKGDGIPDCYQTSTLVLHGDTLDPKETPCRLPDGVLLLPPPSSPPL